jgi:hypothetical protein
VTDSEEAPPPADTWDSILDAMRRRYPGQRDSVLFCIHKLQQNPHLTLRDFRDEANLHRIPVAGRSLHSAKVLLGLGQKAERRASPAQPDAAPSAGKRRPRAQLADASDIEQKVVAAVRQIQHASGAEAERLRAAIRQAIAFLQRAIGDD